MKIYLSLFLSLWLPHGAYAQNLIPNPGFDVITDCPNGASQIELAYPWESASESPDLFNACASIGSSVGVPMTGFFNYQPARSDSGYAGIFVYSSVVKNGREYIQSPLKSGLSEGTDYYVQFFVSPRSHSGTNPNILRSYTDAVGLAFAPWKTVSVPWGTLLDWEPAAENRGKLVKDTVNWTEVSGCYRAKGDERYAVVGNFRSDEETLVETNNPAFPFLNNYFFIEDVLVMGFDPLPDTLLLCNGQPHAFDATFLDATYRWSNGSTAAQAQVNEAGLWTVAADMGNCTLRDTMVVLDLRDPPALPADTLICAGDTVRITAPLPGAYSWSTGAATPTLNALTAGRYELTVTNGCGDFYFDTEVQTHACDCRVYVPNAFSPNASGENNALGISVGCDFPHRFVRFQVFDRWGTQVFSTSDPVGAAWDGTSNGRALPSGVYAWTLTYEYQRKGKTGTVLKYGDVAIIR